MPSAPPAERLRVRQAVVWSAFAALLVLGVVLWLRFADRLVPMVDAVSDR